MLCQTLLEADLSGEVNLNVSVSRLHLCLPNLTSKNRCMWWQAIKALKENSKTGTFLCVEIFYCTLNKTATWKL